MSRPTDPYGEHYRTVARYRFIRRLGVVLFLATLGLALVILIVERYAR